MKEAVVQNCPLCATRAEYYLVDYGNLKYFKCSACTYFQISKQAERVLAQSPQQWRDNYAEKAKHTPSDCLLVIVVPLSSLEHTSSIAVSGEFRSKSECSL